MRLFLNGNLQFHSRDEYRYHEALVHPALAAHGAPRRVLVLGGGDGMAVREILKYPSVEHVTLVELDPHMTRAVLDRAAAARPERRLAALAARCTIVNADAFAWLEQHDELFDAIVVDFPDPTNFSIGKLYTTTLLRAGRPAPLGERLRGRADDLAADRAQELLDRGDDDRGGRPARRRRTTRTCRASASGASSSPAGGRSALPRDAARRACASSTVAGLPALFDFPPDMARVPAEVNRLSNQVLVQTFEDEWGKVQR